MTNVAHFPLLSLILFLPLAGAVLLLFIPNENGNAIRWVANLFALAGFLVSLPLWYGLGEADQDRVIDAVRELIGTRRAATT